MRTLYMCVCVYGGYLNLQNTWPMFLSFHSFRACTLLMAGSECEIASPGLAVSTRSRISSFFSSPARRRLFDFKFLPLRTSRFSTSAERRLMHRNVPPLMGPTRLSKSKSSFDFHLNYQFVMMAGRSSNGKSDTTWFNAESIGNRSGHWRLPPVLGEQWRRRHCRVDLLP